jgi:hypothetical protein
MVFSGEEILPDRVEIQIGSGIVFGLKELSTEQAKTRSMIIVYSILSSLLVVFHSLKSGIMCDFFQWTKARN